MKTVHELLTTLWYVIYTDKSIFLAKLCIVIKSLILVFNIGIYFGLLFCFIMYCNSLLFINLFIGACYYNDIM